MKTQHPHIEALERFTLRRATLQPGEIAEIIDHVKACAFCRDMLDEIDDLMENTLDVNEKSIDLETARIMRMIPISSFRAQHAVILTLQPVPSPSEGANGFALAAKSEGTLVDYQPVATLYSDDGHTLLRILHERGNASYFFQLMSEQTDHIPHALLVAPGKEPMMTDVDGAFRIPDSELDIVQIVSMSVYYALDRMRAGRIESHELASHEGVVLASEDSTIHLRAFDDGLEATVRWHGSETTPPRYIGMVSGHTKVVGTIENGTSRVSLASLSSDCAIVLY
ncbi:MAG: hypothetical protein WBQ23_14560 [Bacteroidota bacterium]